MMLFGLLLLGIILYVVFKGTPDVTKQDDQPLDILRRRYAQGSIDRDEFLRMKDELTGRS